MPNQEPKTNYVFYLLYYNYKEGRKSISVSEINIKYILCNGIEACCTLKVPKQMANAPIFGLYRHGTASFPYFPESHQA